MEFKKVTKDIYNESYYHWLEDEMHYRCLELLEQKIPSLKEDDSELRYDLSYSQRSGVMFTKFNISFDGLIKYLLEIKTLSKEEYDILYAAHDEGLYDFDYEIGSRNKIEASTSIYDIPNTSNTYNLLFKKYGDYYIDDDKMCYTALDDILDSDQIELSIKDLLDSLSYELKSYGYDHIESEDEYECKNILFDSFMELNNIEHNIDYSEGGEYLRTKEEVLDTLEDFTLVNDNNLNDYYIANDLLGKIIEQERTVLYNSLPI